MNTNDDRFFIIYDSYVSDLGLSGLSLMVYSLIRSFCSHGQGYFNGSVSYLAQRTGKSPNGIRKALKELAKKGLIEKTPPKVNGNTPVYTIPGLSGVLHSVVGNTALSMYDSELSGDYIKEIEKYKKDHLDMSSSELLGITDISERTKCVREFAYLFSDEDINGVSPRYVGIVDLMTEMIAQTEASYKGESVSADSVWRAFVLNLRKDELGLSIRDFIESVANRINDLKAEKIIDPNQYMKAVIWNMLKKCRLIEL